MDLAVVPGLNKNRYPQVTQSRAFVLCLGDLYHKLSILIVLDAKNVSSLKCNDRKIGLF